MLHFFFKWRYERRSRSNAFQLPDEGSRRSRGQVYLGDFIARQSSGGSGFKHYDRPRRRRKWIRSILLAVLTLLLVWIIYESALALAAMSS